MNTKMTAVALGALTIGLVTGLLASAGMAYLAREPVDHGWDQVPLSAEFVDYDDRNGEVVLRVQNHANSAAPMAWVNMKDTPAYLSSTGNATLWMGTYNESASLTATQYAWPAGAKGEVETFWLAPYDKEEILIRFPPDLCLDSVIYRGDRWISEVIPPAMDPLVVPIPEGPC